ncbi:DegV family protein [Clostridium gasigenes]|uniref:DegV family protein n=1 Tax=Clostridium gasigenes TaxID=94869 RepID=UPI001C0D9C96|nr:DegV family protein [Clostridium gasigenes]MBU3137503.1 DegV family protein [Clostridium gasigenes]
MQKIALITDSSCDLSLETLKENNINMLPLNIIYSYGEFEDRVSITPEEVYEKLGIEIPSTSLPSTKKINSVLDKLEEEGYTHVIAITISSGLSGTFNAVRLALEDHPKLISHVYDTKMLAYGEGMIVLEAAKAIKEGQSFENIISTLPKLRGRISAYFTLNTLEYLKIGGRIGKVAGTIGELLNLKPVIGVDDNGVYYTACKARGRKQALSKLTDILKEALSKGKCKIQVLQGGALEEGKAYLESIKNLENIVEIGIASISPALGVHVGPGLIGLAIHKIY